MQGLFDLQADDEQDIQAYRMMIWQPLELEPIEEENSEHDEMEDHNLNQEEIKAAQNDDDADFGQ